MKIIKGETFDLERSLYNLKDTTVDNCTFEGANDGESVLKECRNIIVTHSNFSLRYPLWHALDFKVDNSSFDELSRAPFWYCQKGELDNLNIRSVKALRECSDINIINSDIESPEFGWKCRDIKIDKSRIVSEYMLFESKNIEISNLDFKGKYSFQYVDHLIIKDSNLDTKDAFWHANNVTVSNSVIKGEYLGWFSNNLTLINCKIIGTQPLCYCKNLKLIDCEMIDCDLSFEYSDVEATIKGHIDSIKNPKSGKIVVSSIGSIINSDSIMESNAEIIIK